MTKIPSHEIKELFNVEAIHVDKGYITLRGNSENGSVRITFIEFVGGQEEIKSRVAVNMSHETMFDLLNALSQVAHMLQPAKQDVVENTETPKDGPELLQ